MADPFFPVLAAKLMTFCGRCKHLAGEGKGYFLWLIFAPPPGPARPPLLLRRCLTLSRTSRFTRAASVTGKNTAGRLRLNFR